jgi:hypothetical protein
MARACVFCGATPVTREHLWPDWARKRMAEEGALHHRQILDRQGEARIDREWLKQAYSMTVRVVCATCNSGWMSALENRAKKLSEPILDGRGRELHREGQRTLATWALKTALMIDQSQSRDGHAFPQAVYDHLRAHGQPPLDMRIWMASYGGDRLGFTHLYGMDVDITQAADRGVREIHGATVAFGPVVFQVFGATIDGLVDGLRVGAPPVVHQLWPYDGTFTWTPAGGFDDKALLSFAEAIPANLQRRVVPER